MPIPILMPALSPTMEEGTLAKWLVKEGDKIESGDVIAEIETDKATMEVEAVDEGTIGKILVSAGTENVKVNDTIAVILEEGEDEAALEATPTATAPAPPAAPSPAPTNGAANGAAPMPAQAPTKTPSPAPAPASNGQRLRASPLAKRLAAEGNLELSALSGTGPHGRIVKRDVLSALEQGIGQAKAPSAPASAPAKAPAGAKGSGGLQIPGAGKAEDLGYAPETYTLKPVDGMRKTIARRLTEAKVAIPHYYLTIDIALDELMKVRKDLNSRSPEGEGAYKISVNDFIIRASALGLQRVPAANASWSEDGILEHKHSDVAMAVAIDGGLFTPVIRAAETKGLSTIAREAKALAGKARDRKLMPEEYQGGSFSISNLGMFGIKHFTAVINPPHAMIMAVGAGEQRPVIKDGAISTATLMTVTLSCDHRVVDGALGAKFLEAVKGYLEDPLSMLL